MLRRSLCLLGTAAVFASCSTAAPIVTPVPSAIAPSTADRRLSIDPRVQSSHSGSFAAAARRAPFTLKDFHGAMGAYIEALRHGGYLAATPKSTSWLDRAAFDRTSAEGDVRVRDDASPTPANDIDLLYGVNNDEATVDIYQTRLSEPATQDRPIIGQIALPTLGVSVAVDTHQHVYVGAGHAIYEYTRESLPNPIRTITLPHSAEGMTVTADGTIYAANFYAYEQGNPAIFVIAKGATSPTSTLSDPTINNGYRLATDSAGNVYFIYLKVPQNVLALGEFPAGSTTFVPIPLSEYPSDVQIDQEGDLLVPNVTAAQVTTLDRIPSGSYSPAHTTVIESKFDYLTIDHKPLHDHLYLLEENVGQQTPQSPIYEYAYTAGLLLDTVGSTTQYFAIASAPFGKLPPPWAIPTGPAPTPSPTAPPTAPPTATPSGSPTTPATSCSNATDGPLLDAESNTLTFGGATTCVGSGGYDGPNGVTTTATLYNGVSGSEISTFSFAATASSHAQHHSFDCPGVGSYYVTVTSTVAAAVTSSTVEATKNSFGAPSC